MAKNPDDIVLESLLVRPSLAALNEELATLCREANRGMRARTADLRISDESWGQYHTYTTRAGGGHSYRNARTTLVGCVWTEILDVRVVRICVERRGAPLFRRREPVRESYPFGYSARQWADSTYLSIVIASPQLNDVRKELVPAMAKWRQLHDLLGALPVAADWLEDQGLPTKAVRALLALLTSPDTSWATAEAIAVAAAVRGLSAVE